MLRQRRLLGAVAVSSALLRWQLCRSTKARRIFHYLCFSISLELASASVRLASQPFLRLLFRPARQRQLILKLALKANLAPWPVV